MKSSMLCQICGEGKLTAQREDNAKQYKGVSKTIPMHFSVCDKCRSEQATPYDLRENKRLMNAFKKSVDNLLLGEELQKIRTQKWQITQAQASKIFGGGPVAFSKYESDEIIQSESMDKLLRVAAAVPEAFTFLLQQEKIPLVATRKKIEVMFTSDDIVWSVTKVGNDVNEEILHTPFLGHKAFITYSKLNNILPKQSKSLKVPNYG